MGAQVAQDLISLARSRFQNLTGAETLAIRAAAVGEVAACGPISEYADSLDPFKLNTDWSKRVIRADIVRWLCLEGGTTELVPRSGIQIFAAMIVGELDMQYSLTPFPLTLQSRPHYRHYLVQECTSLFVDPLRKPRFANPGRRFRSEK